MEKIVLVTFTITLAACESVEVLYTSPATAEDFASIEKQANDHYEFFAFPKTFILVSAVEQDVTKQSIDSNVSTKTDGGTSGKSKPGQKTSNNAVAKVEKSASKNTPNETTAAKGASASSAASIGVISSDAKGEPADATQKNADEPTTTALALNDSLASAVIDGARWEAKVVLMPDDKRTLAVKGISGFWKSTTIGVSKYQNSDLVSSVSSTAENLVPKRIGQVASIIATVVQIGAAVGVDGTRKKTMPLQSFVVEIPSKGRKSDTINDDWTYTFAYDSEDLPDGTVSYDAFKKKAMNRKVTYWPTPACRSATLKIGRASDSTQAAFHVVVSSPDVIRLQPLPVKGKLDFGSACGATASGTASVDPVASLSDDLQAVQQAVKTVKDAKKPTTSDSASRTKDSGAAASAPTK